MFTRFVPLYRRNFVWLWLTIISISLYGNLLLLSLQDVAFYASWIEEQKTSDKCDCPFPFSIFNGFRETVRSWVGDNWV